MTAVRNKFLESSAAVSDIEAEVQLAAQGADPVLPVQVAKRPLRPFWLRPLLLVAIVAAHIAPFLTFATPVEAPPATRDIDVSMIAQGEAMAEQQAAPEISKEETVDAAVPVVQPPLQPQTPPDLTAPMSAIENPDAVVVPKEQQTPIVQPPPPEPPKPVEAEKPKEEPPKIPEPEKKKPEPKKPVAEHKSVARRKAVVQDKTRMGDENKNVGLRTGTAVDTGMSTATYRAVLLQQVAAHKFTPPGADPGSIVVSFTVNASGQVTSVSASGNPILADAARKIVRSVQAPPPPGGSFHGSVTLRFGPG